jgi:hypothetical protein
MVALQDVRAVQAHAASKGGFVVQRSEILGAEYVPGPKWGMGPIPHTGRINLRLASGKTRELILLGYVDPEQIKQEILSGVPARKDAEVRNNSI